MKFLMHILFLIMTSITWTSYLQAASKVDSADTSCAQTIPSQTASGQVSHPSDEPGLKFNNNAANISNAASSLRVSHNPEERVERTQGERHVNCTKWAMEGMLSPCIDEVGDISAPVAQKSTLQSSPKVIFRKIYEHNTEAEHPQPEPPAWTSCRSRSKIISPQSLWFLRSIPCSDKSRNKSSEPTAPRSPVTIAP